MGRIFVSHSAKDQDERDALDAINAALREADHTVLEDLWPGRLQPGVEWRREIHTMMAFCHAAVVLLSENALESDWVTKEATVLAWRQSLDKDFVLIPILLPPVKRSALAQGPLRPLALTEIQFGTLGNLADVMTRLEGVGGPDVRLPSDAWIRRLALDLSQIEVLGANTGAQVIEDAAKAADVDLDWIPAVSRSERLARRLVSLETKAVEQAVASLADVVRTGDALDDLIEALVPVWVDPLSAAPIPEVAGQEAGLRAVGIVAEDAWVGEMYVLRAGCGLSTWRICRANNTGEGEDTQADHVINELYADGLRALRLPPQTSVDAFIEAAAAFAKRGDRLFAIIPNRGTLTNDQITAIHDRLKVFTLVLLGSRPTATATVTPGEPPDMPLDLGEAGETTGRLYRDYLRSFRTDWVQ